MPDYEPIRRLGAGAFGEVWLVFDRALGINLAVKTVHPDRILTPTNFYHEPQTLKALQHDRVVTVEDAGRLADGRLYIAMEHIPKGSIEDVSKGGIVPLRQAVGLICDVCWALEYAHSKDYLHRDVKPANILVTNSGHGKLSDFGLATRAQRTGIASPHGYLTHLAPEVMSQGITTCQTDIYAVGVTLYRMINGDAYLPTPAKDDDLETMIAEGAYPNRTKYRAFIPRQMRRVVNKAMHTDPTSRYQSASELRLAIEGLSVTCDWHEQPLPDGFSWTARTPEREFVAERRGRRREYSFAVSQTIRGGSPRRMRQDCRQALSKSEATRHAHSVLSRITLAGR